MSTVIVAGAAGFIASHVSSILLNDGHEVIGIDNINNAYDRRLKEWRLSQLRKHTGFELHEVDISVRDEVDRLFTDLVDIRTINPTAVVNLAARAGVRQSVLNPWVYYETNVTGTLNLLEQCRRFSIPKFVLASTSSVYGQNADMPSREDQVTDLSLSPYTASKKAAEVLCHTYHYLYGIDVSVFRYFTVFGPAGRPDMSLFRFTKWISEGKPVRVYGDGSQSRDFTFVEDIARGTVAGLRPLGYQIINLGSDSPIVLLDAIKTIEKCVGKKANLIFEPAQSADVPASWADVSRATSLLDWRPSVPFEAGMDLTVQWYKKHLSWAKELHTGL